MILGILTSCADVGSERSCTEGSDVEALVPSRSLDISLPDQSYQPPSIQKASLPVLPSDNGGLAYNLTPTLEEVKEDIVEGSSLPQGMAIDVREISENAIRNKTGQLLLVFSSWKWGTESTDLLIPCPTWVWV
ncbi:hypothetical protein CK203_105679 [Vitis vinifera]|uniref:Uncharacterized protein n=1 Tax=Vitis vinifera TaxID=29760 RepID=A0A438DCR9_VITVI|nr:hypothetical protein CK203_105679 [Vitis vinifera]